MKIHKFTLPSTFNFFELPSGFHILDIQMQNGLPVMWVSGMFDDFLYKNDILVKKFFTGVPIDPDGHYIKTLQEPSGLVYHYFLYKQ